MNVSALQEAASSERDVPLGSLVADKTKKVVRFDLSPSKITGLINPGEATKTFMQTYFPGTTVEEWNDWKWQIRNSYLSLHQLSPFIELSGTEKQVLFSPGTHLPLRITPYYASLLTRPESGPVIRKAMVPGIEELTLSPGEHADPLNEEDSSPVRHLVHRYPDRVLFLATGFCSAYCRYCTRTHMVAREKVHFNRDWEQAINYIRQHTEIRDVLISGGDPLTMPTPMLKNLLTELRHIPHVEIIRIGTKVPVVLPQRITPELTRMLKQFHPLMISIHFMHPSELTPETAQACTRLADAGIPLGSQTVLLKDINDDVETMKKLMLGLLKIRVRPYYLYQCDPIPGSAHFRTPVSKGIEIIRGLRGFTSGYAVPNFVIDAPGGGGKIPLIPDYFQGRTDKEMILKNYEGKIFYYPDLI
jgi:lysine 2,3-aminomutase